ncbi:MULTISPECIES: hypothetical protein [Cyanophyceae]|uniref:hypothetical protein n=1 Tax=Cyanophyceae TaxID=3028117 RepID=UPI001689324C|nr:hypothetical protein [Trichocoleus sp. FACHB-69]MBD1930338.1 hypothetical protein [Trichocoleus sp. FACHB-69]
MKNRATTFARDGVTREYSSKMKFMTRQHDVYDLLSVLLNASRRAVACATELVQYFTKWDEWKQKTQRTPWIYKPLHEIEADLRAYSTRVIRYALSLLEQVGILERRHNPGNCLDRTYQYRIHLEKLTTPDPIRDNSPSATPIKNNSFLQEALEDILPKDEPLDNESFLETVSSHDSGENDSSPPSSPKTRVVDDFTQLANASVKTNNAFASSVLFKHKNLSISNRSISLCQEESKQELSSNYEVIGGNLYSDIAPWDLIPSDYQRVEQEELTPHLGKKEVKKEYGSQERTGAGEDKSSAAAPVKFVENPHTVKHDKPDYYSRGFNSQLELDGFYQALLELGKQKASVRSPVGWANNIIKDINAGGLCEYLNEYRRGEPLGMCEKQEWEIGPGQVYPQFLRFLSCRLKTDQMSGEQSIAAAHRALRDKGEAYELWESFKRTVVNFADQWERDKALGVSGVYVPPELLPDADVTLEEAAEAMQLLQSNSVQSNESPELVPPAPPEVLVSASASEEEAEVQGAGCKREEISLADKSPAASEVSTTREREKNLHLLAQIERMREFLKSGNSVKVTIARQWVGSNLDVVEPIKVNGVIVDVSYYQAGSTAPEPKP